MLKLLVWEPLKLGVMRKNVELTALDDSCVSSSASIRLGTKNKHSFLQEQFSYS